MYNNKKIYIFGMARSGYEAAKLLVENGAYVTMTDASVQDEEKMKEMNELGIKVIITDKQEDYLDDSFDYVVKNPGIKPSHPLCVKAHELNIPIINEVEVAYNLLDKGVKIVAVTGSNGKTTTTTLIYEILKKASIPVYLGGNIGYPVCSLVDKAHSGDTLVLEISGQQLYNVVNFKTDIGVLTNLTEVHIDYFGTYEVYKHTKASIFKHHTKNDIAIINVGNDDVIEETKNIESTKITFSSSVDADLYLKDGSIYYKSEKIVDICDIKLQGNHNYENIMCAIAVAKQYNVSNDVIREYLSQFGGVEHRIEYVKTVNGREFYNDSKATNVKSTQIALASFSKPTILLLGGLDRKHSFEGLTSYMKNVKYVLCFGETKNRIKEYCDRINVECKVVDTLKEAVYEAYSKSCDGDVILLSPACASWDQYKCFEDRGCEFKSEVGLL